MLSTSSCAAYELQYSAAMLLCHVCAEAGGGGGKSGSGLLVVSSQLATLLWGGGGGYYRWGVALGVDSRAGQRKVVGGWVG